MPATEPISIISAGISDEPRTPVRIVNWDEFIQAVITALATTGIPSLIVGDYPTSYTEFDVTGFMQAYGDATAFKDELQSLVSNAAVITPANDIVINAAECTRTFKATARYPTDYLATTHQLNHDWYPGTVIDPHLHFEQVNAEVPNFLLGYRWQKQGQAKTTAWTLLPFDDLKFTYTAGTLNQIIDCGGITPPAGYGQVSDIIDIHLWRDYLNASGEFSGAETSGLDIEVKNLDSHKEINRLGSDEEYS